MSDPYLRYRDITVEESQEENIFDGAATTYWTATMTGYIVPNGVQVVMSRTGETASDAVIKLKDALKEQGYDVRAER